MSRKITIALCVSALLLASAVLAASRGFGGAERFPSLEAGEAASETGWQPVVATDGALEVELLVNGVPLQEYLARGRRYVEALEGAEYEISLRNTLPVRVAVALSVDGLNSIDAKHTTAWNASKWVVDPYQTIRIGGGGMRSERARRLFFTPPRESFPAEMGQTANFGLFLAVVFFRPGPA